MHIYTMTKEKLNFLQWSHEQVDLPRWTRTGKVVDSVITGSSIQTWRTGTFVHINLHKL